MTPSKEYSSLKYRQSGSPESKSITLPNLNKDESFVNLHDRSDLFSNSRRTGNSNGKKRRSQPTVVNNLVKKKSRIQRKPQASFSSSPIKSKGPQTDEANEIGINILDTFNKKRYQYDASTDYLESTYNNADVNNTDSETETQLINLKQLSSSPTKTQPKDNKGDVQKLDEMIAIESNKYDDYIKNAKINEQNETIGDNFAVEMMKGNILSTMEDRKQANILLVCLKFKDKGYPKPISSKKSLLKEIESYFYIIPQILKGKIGTSYFYDMAKSQSLSSNHETMTQKEKWSINWPEFFGGYYGFKRQLFIASIIVSRHKKDLQNAANKNKTVSYWTINGFATFVLANEIIIRFIMHDFDCCMTEAETIIKESSEYGTAISDSIELTDDLNIGELLNDESKEFMKGITFEDTNMRDLAENKNNKEDEKLPEFDNTNKPKVDILDQFLDYSSEEDN